MRHEFHKISRINNSEGRAFGGEECWPAAFALTSQFVLIREIRVSLLSFFEICVA